MDMRHSILLVALAITRLTFAASQPRGQADADAGLAAAIADSLKSDDQWQDGLRQLRELGKRNPRLVQAKLRGQFLKPLLKHELFDDIETLAMQGIIADPSNCTGCDEMQRCRVEALLAAGENEEALSAAKGYYNVCMTWETDIAIDLFAEALRKARGDKDSGIVIRFKLQQAEGAKLPKETSTPATLPSDLGENVLKEVKVQPTAELDAWLKNYATLRHTFSNRVAHGNVLLLTDHVAEAEMEFEHAMEGNTTEIGAAIQNIARGYRAVDMTVGRANAFILHLREGAPSSTQPSDIIQ
jgi:hypothetical protein